MRIYNYIVKLHETPEHWTIGHIRYLNIFLSGIHNTTFSNSKYINKFEKKDKKFKIPFQSLVEQCTFKKYKEVINWLVENEYVIVNNQWVRYELCKGYIINKDSNIYKGISVITDFDELKEYNKFLKRRVRKQDRLTEAKLDNVYDKDILNYNRKLIQNGEVGFNEGGKKLCKIGLNILKKQSKLLPKGSEERKSLAISHNKAHCGILTIMGKEGRISFDKQQARYCTPFTTLSNNFIKYITFEDKGFLQLDIKNSQPQFLNIELKQLFPNEYANNPEIKYVSDRIESGEIYDEIKDRLELINTRGEVKESMYLWIFSHVFADYLFADPTGKENKTELSKKIVKFFTLEYPSFFNLIDNYKLSLVKKGDKIKDTGKLLARKLQKKESDIVKRIYREVIMKHNLPCITKHDSFILPEDTPHSIIEEIIYYLRAIGIHIDHNSIEYQRDLLTEREIEILGIGEEKIHRYVDPLMVETITELYNGDELLDICNSDFDILSLIIKKGRRINKDIKYARIVREEIKKLSKESKELINKEILLKTKKYTIRPPDDPIPEIKHEKINYDDFLLLQV